MWSAGRTLPSEHLRYTMVAKSRFFFICLNKECFNGRSGPLLAALFPRTNDKTIIKKHLERTRQGVLIRSGSFYIATIQYFWMR